MKGQRVGVRGPLPSPLPTAAPDPPDPPGLSWVLSSPGPGSLSSCPRIAAQLPGARRFPALATRGREGFGHLTQSIRGKNWGMTSRNEDPCKRSDLGAIPTTSYRIRRCLPPLQVTLRKPVPSPSRPCRLPSRPSFLSWDSGNPRIVIRSFVHSFNKPMSHAKHQGHREEWSLPSFTLRRPLCVIFLLRTRCSEGFRWSHWLSVGSGPSQPVFTVSAYILAV